MYQVLVYANLKGNSNDAYKYRVSYYEEQSFSITKFTGRKPLNPAYLLNDKSCLNIYTTQYLYKLMKMQSIPHCPTPSYTKWYVL